MSDIGSNILISYGVFLIVCGITSVVFIGLKAKTALISGGTSGCIAILIAYFIKNGYPELRIAGMVFAFALFVVFSWRSTKTLFTVFEMIRSGHADLKGKGIAFLIISLMAVVSIVVVGLQVALYV